MWLRSILTALRAIPPLPRALTTGFPARRHRFRPALEYSFVMKTAGGESETITTRDREQVFELRGAIENAFLMLRELAVQFDMVGGTK